MDLFDKLTNSPGPLVQLSQLIHGTVSYPRLTGEIGNRMRYQGNQQVMWSLNNYLGLANHPEIRRVDAEAAARYGLAAPMGARMMSGDTDDLEALERELADFLHKPEALFLNYGYQGMVSLVDALLSREDHVLYDRECHACIIDGVRLRRGRAQAFRHNDVGHLEELLAGMDRAPDAAVLVITEGVFGMSGDQGRLADIVALKERYGFRFLVDDAHGFGVTGATGRGTGEAQGVHDDIDLYFGTFAKAGASIGAFVAAQEDVIWHLRYTLRSQIFSKGLPWPIIVGNRARLALMRDEPSLRERCWEVAHALQSGLRAAGMDLGSTTSPVTPVFLTMSHLEAYEYVQRLRNKYRVFCSAVTHPVVPPGVLQLRLIPTAVHTSDDIDITVDALPRAHREVMGRAASVAADQAS